MKIALAGNPNSGKTTLFNEITGKTEYVGNWPGVTVQKKEANLRGMYKRILRHSDIGNYHCTDRKNGENDCCKHNFCHSRVVDLPGAYSISPYTSEEAITRDFVLDEKPDVIINIIDASSLERSLFFTTQLLELGIPLVIALNKQDMVRRYGNIIDVKGLANSLNCSIIETSANQGEGLNDLIRAVADVVRNNQLQVAPVFEGKMTENEDKYRQQFIKNIINKHLIKKRDARKITISDKIDRVVANGFLGLPIFAVIMWAVYAFSIGGLGGFLSGYFNEVIFREVVPNVANSFFESIGVHPLLQALIVDGAIGGVGAVIGFLPLIMVLFFCLGLLEDSGYMSRVAVVMDRYFKKIGLSGKSIIPMIVGSGCSIPGVMSTRTIEDINERRITILLTPFIPCSAKLPIIALFAAVFFPGDFWVAPSMYILAIAMIIIGGLFFKKIFHLESTSSFIIELPDYKVPSIKHAYKQMMNQAKAFIVKASTIILVMNTVVWFMQTFSWNLKVVEDSGLSILASIGGIIAPLLIPLGFIGWQLAAASLTGFIAKENVVATFAIILFASSEEALFMPGGVLTQFFTPVTGYAFLAFNLFTPPCFAAIGAMNAELGSRKWLGKAIIFQLSIGYILAMIINQIGTIVFYGQLAVGFIPAIIVIIFYLSLIVYLIRRSNKKRRDIPVLAN